MYRRGGLGETTVQSPNVDVPITGTLTIDGVKVALADARGGQTHLWGTKHAAAWAWGTATRSTIARARRSRCCTRGCGGAASTCRR
jgi:hypothetical protein